LVLDKTTSSLYSISMNDKNKPETGVVINAQGRTTAPEGTKIVMSGKLYIVNGLGKVVP